MEFLNELKHLNYEGITDLVYELEILHNDKTLDDEKFNHLLLIVKNLVEEIEDCNKENYNFGFEDGTSEGYDEGYKAGHDGYDEGYRDGTESQNE